MSYPYSRWWHGVSSCIVLILVSFSSLEVDAFKSPFLKSSKSLSGRVYMSSRATNTRTGGRTMSSPRLLVDARALLEETLKVAREIGLRAGVSRSVQAAIAASETARELAIALADYRSGKAKDPPSLARLTRTLFSKLGATYIKIGQFIASSPTLFPPEFVTEFAAKMLDKTDPVPFEAIREVVLSELGPRAFTDIFSSFNEVPLASASVAQVHVARLRTGEQVAVKVLKPGVEDALKADLGFIYLASRLLETIAPDFAATSIGDIVSDIRTSILEEVDFTKEAQNLQYFKEFLDKASLTEQATCPRVYRQYSSRRVLVMERLLGVSLLDLDNIRDYTDDPEATVIRALNVWSLSVVMCPIFHADVHAGNLLVLQDGRLGFIDFGIVGRIPAKIWRAVTTFAEGLASEDYDLMADGLIAMGATSQGVNPNKLSLDLRMLFERLRGLDSTLVVQGDPQSVAAAVAVDEEQLTRLLIEMADVARSNGLKLPREFGLFIKQALYFDRYLKILAPDLKDPINDPRVKLWQSEAEALAASAR